MTTLFTLLVLAAMIGACVLLIHLANARHTALPTTVQPHRWRLRRRGAAVRHTVHRPLTTGLRRTPTESRRRARPSREPRSDTKGRIDRGRASTVPL